MKCYVAGIAGSVAERTSGTAEKQGGGGKNLKVLARISRPNGRWHAPGLSSCDRHDLVSLSFSWSTCQPGFGISSASLNQSLHFCELVSLLARDIDVFSAAQAAGRQCQRRYDNYHIAGLSCQTLFGFRPRVQLLRNDFPPPPVLRLREVPIHEFACLGPHQLQHPPASPHSNLILS